MSADELAIEYPFFSNVDSNQDLVVTAFEWAERFFENPQDESASFTKDELHLRLIDNAQVIC
jgi:hypothetical protein